MPTPLLCFHVLVIPTITKWRFRTSFSLFFIYFRASRCLYFDGTKNMLKTSVPPPPHANRQTHTHRPKPPTSSLHFSTSTSSSRARRISTPSPRPTQTHRGFLFSGSRLRWVVFRACMHACVCVFFHEFASTTCFLCLALATLTG